MTRFVAVILILFSVLAVSLLMAGNPDARSSDLVRGPIHWHAHLSLVSDGQFLTVPADIGITSGLNIENDISGAEASPVHTHDESGFLHFEVDDYALRSDRVTLGYFFQIWQRPLSNSCFLGFCTDSTHQLRFFVNGKERLDWRTYPVQDGDDLVLAWVQADLPQRSRY